MSLFLIILGLVLFICLVLVHEWGHYKAARSSGVDVEEFGLGFPPRIWGKKLKSGMLLSVNLLPLGGFVKLKGEHDADRSKGSFGAASDADKIRIMLAGVVMNLVVAISLFTLLAMTGLPKLIPHQFSIKSDTKIVRNDVYVGYIEPDSPASSAGLRVGDRLLRYSSDDCSEAQTCKLFSSADGLRAATSSNAGKTITVEYERDRTIKTASVNLRSNEEVEASNSTDNPKGFMGVLPSEFTQTRSTWSAPIQGVVLSYQITKETFKGIGRALSSLVKGDTTTASEQVSGPLGIFKILQEGSRLGINFLLVIIAVISLTLAIMNVLPIPALDGGRLFVMMLFRYAKRPLSKETEERIHGTGFAILMLLFILITIVDVKRFY
ncbi:site-2 protease family protein [Candidatus Saccharibacteria bacterium]|jgi:regulator of sigma E protease|nr:MAG: site-2 protease family protein [Candidatus Saccharibacteria bacterium]